MGVRFPLCYRVTQLADLAQLAEQRTRNAQVAGSSPAIGIDTTLGASQDELYQEKKKFFSLKMYPFCLTPNN